MSNSNNPVCKRCGNSAVTTRHSESDPLQVSECTRCGSVLGIDGHAW